MLAIAWQYLTGRAVAEIPAGRPEHEWPPHPDRVFQALVAAWGQGGRDASLLPALIWLEGLEPPEIASPEPISACGAEKVYVPVNDVDAGKAKTYGKGLDALLPSRRTRKERFFRGCVVEDAVVALRWPAADPGPYREALSRICAMVTHIGHSRSMVRAWVCDDPPEPTWVPSGDRGDATFRIMVPGRFAALESSFAMGGAAWRRPTTAPWHPYEKVRPTPCLASGEFDDRLLVFRRIGGDRPGLLQALAFTDALRGALMIGLREHPTLCGLVAGHAAQGGRLEGSHAAFLPLADVGHPHADGHLLGLAVALPRSLDPAESFDFYKLLASRLDAETGALRLVAGRYGAMELVQEDRPAPPLALRPSTWTRASRAWATVTPLVLDRLPPRAARPGPGPQGKAHDAWLEGEVLRNCLLQGLPRPDAVAIRAVSRFSGVPSTREFLPLRRRPDGASRWHVHVALSFPEPIEGPLVLGAGRYRGHGLFRPLEDGCP